MTITWGSSRCSQPQADGRYPFGVVLAEIPLREPGAFARSDCLRVKVDFLRCESGVAATRRRQKHYGGLAALPPQSKIVALNMARHYSSRGLWTPANTVVFGMFAYVAFARAAAGPLRTQPPSSGYFALSAFFCGRFYWVFCVKNRFSRHLNHLNHCCWTDFK
jgi:hypothetical protein